MISGLLGSNFAFSDILLDCINSEQTRALLTSAAYVHLKHAEVSKYTRNLAPASRAILLSGPAGWLSGFCILSLSIINLLTCFFKILEELYQQMLAKALAHYFETKLLLLDVTDFSLKASYCSCKLLVLFVSF